jgi:hypothetical protein
MTLKLIPCGLDFGNGHIKISLQEKVSKIPNWVTSQEPKGALNKKTMIAAKPMAFALEINGQSKWFGQDTLSLGGEQEIDEDKYKPAYIKMMFKAVLFRWLDQHRIEPEWLEDKRLSIICGMPPEQYQDRAIRGKAEKVYGNLFEQNKPDYIKIPDEIAIPFFTSFKSLRPETLAWRAVYRLKPGYTLLVDLGYGTSDFCLLHSSKEMPLKTISLPNGLLHVHNENNPTSPWLSELETMRGDKPDNYANITKSKIRQIARQVNLAQLVVFGGGVQLLDTETIKDIKGYAENVSLGRGYDEFSNARWFEKLAKRRLENDV